MNILFVAPLTRKITKQTAVSRQRIMLELMNNLVKRGHVVTLLGTKDSVISGVKVFGVISRGFYEITGEFENPFYAHTAYLAIQAKQLEKLAPDFDIIHNHAYPEFINLLPVQKFHKKIITTLHTALPKHLDDIFSFFPESKIVCPSNLVKNSAKKTKIHKVIPHGVDTDIFGFSDKKEDYLLWIGRLSKAKDSNGEFIDPKGLKIAIALAKETGENLRLVANVEDASFYEKEVKPHLSDKIKWIGPISEDPPLGQREIAKLMQGAKALLMTARFPEAFGLVIAEAQSCGTPVIGFKQGPAPEIIIPGKTGFLADIDNGINGLKDLVQNIRIIKPQDCRDNAVRRFSLDYMINAYESLYREIAASS